MTPEERADAVAFPECFCLKATEGIVQCLRCRAVAVIRAAVEEEREACAALIDTRHADVLARQYGTGDVYQFQSDVDTQIRMVAVLLPDLSAAIRARGQQ